MHVNQAKNKKPARKRTWLRWVLLGVIGVGAAVAGWFYLGQPGNPLVQAATPAAVSNYTAVARRGDLKVSVSGTGVLIASRSVDLNFTTAGTLASVKVKLGDKVKAGDTLAQLSDPVSLKAAETSAQLALLQAQKALRDLQTNAPVALAQSFSDWLKAQDAYNTDQAASQRTDLARCTREVTTKYKATLDNATSKLNQLNVTAYGSDQWLSIKGTYDQALANYTYCIAYTPSEKSQAQATTQSAQAALQLAEAKYNTLKANNGIDPSELALAQAQVQQSEAQLAQAKQNSTGATMTAPISGTVIFLAAQTGEMIDTSKFITLADTSQATVKLSVDETQAQQLTLNTPAVVTFDALPDTPFSGKVTEIDPQLTVSGQYQLVTGQVTLDASAVQALQAFPLGLNATVEVIRQQAKNAVLVPIEALRDLGNGDYAVFKVDQAGKLHLTSVKVGIKDTTHAEILSGLKEGDTVSTGTAQTSGK